MTPYETDMSWVIREHQQVMTRINGVMWEVKGRQSYDQLVIVHVINKILKSYFRDMVIVQLNPSRYRHRVVQPYTAPCMHSLSTSFQPRRHAFHRACWKSMSQLTLCLLSLGQYLWRGNEKVYLVATCHHLTMRALQRHPHPWSSTCQSVCS